MAKKDLRTCCVCRQKFSFCPVCNSEDVNKPLWHFAYCSENCKNIYEITSAFEDERMNDTEAKEKLEGLDLSRQEYFGESYKKSIASIMKAKTHAKKTTLKKGNKKAEEKSASIDIVTKAEDEAKSNVE